MQILKKIRIDLYRLLFNYLPIKKNKVIMWSNGFKNYACNPKYIAEQLINSGRDYDIVWVFSKKEYIPSDFPKQIRVVLYFSIKYLFEIATAKVIICNSRTAEHYYMKKRKNQVYIQTWHSSLRLKKIEKDAEHNLPERYINMAKQDSKKIDYILSGCRFSSDIFKNSFWYNGEILEIGTPRIDFLKKKDSTICEKVHKVLNIEKENIIVLYAPTFRAENTIEICRFDYQRIIRIIEEKYNKKCTILIKHHPNLQEQEVDIQTNENVKNVTRYSDIQELLCVADLLITDYSSSMFDCACVGKPCVLYMPDYESYISKERELYFNISQLPFPKAYTQKDLEKAIQEFDYDSYQEKVQQFMRQIHSFEEGNACETIEGLIRKICDI